MDPLELEKIRKNPKFPWRWIEINQFILDPWFPIKFLEWNQHTIWWKKLTNISNIINNKVVSYRYKWTPPYTKTILTNIPPLNATPITKTLTDSLRSINSNTYPTKVSLTIHHSLLFTITVGLNPCDTCITDNKLVSSINNITFLMPTISSTLL